MHALDAIHAALRALVKSLQRVALALQGRGGSAERELGECRGVITAISTVQNHTKQHYKVSRSEIYFTRGRVSKSLLAGGFCQSGFVSVAVFDDGQVLEPAGRSASWDRTRSFPKGPALGMRRHSGEWWFQ